MAIMTQGLTAWLNRLIRGELAAVETYQQAMDKMQDAPEATELQVILTEHRAAVKSLADHVGKHGGTPESSSGAWGAWAKLVERTAQALGNTAALEALRQGEQHGIKEYERAMADDELEKDCRTLIKDQLLPQARAHIPVLDRLIDLQ